MATADKFTTTILARLSEGRLNHVISVLRNKCEEAADAHPMMNRIITSLDSLSETYSRLRQFMLQGVPDPERLKLYESIKEQVVDLSREYLFCVNEDRLDAFFANYRMQKVNGADVADILERIEKLDFKIKMASETEVDPLPFIRRREQEIGSLFLKVWSLAPWEKASKDSLREFLLDDGKDFIIRSQIISALLIGLLKFNDPDKLLMLISAYNSTDDDRIAARSLLAIVLILSRWGDSALSSPLVKSALESLTDSLLSYTRLRDIIMTVIRTFDTDRVSREVKDAFDSTMKAISPEMLKKLSDEGLSIDAGDMGMNPEWEKLMQNKDLEEKMQAVNDMQLEGMDVMMQTFAKLKSFSFFRSVANWFLPFSSDHSEVSNLFRQFDEEAFSLIADATGMCGGDRFSFVFGILQMPEDRRNLMATSIGASLDLVKEQLKVTENIKRKSVFETEALSFSRDIYRFTKLYPRKRDFYDPFEAPVDFIRLPVLGEMLTDNEIILRSADFYFDHGYWPLALSLYEKAVSLGVADRQMFEKIGFCCQSQSDYVSALQNYEKADLFSSDTDNSSTWLMRKLAFCNKALGNYSRAAEYYERLLERNPDDLNIEFHLGSVLLRAGDIKRAKEIISKIHYINPEHQVCGRIYNRLKGHDAFLAGNFKEASELYEKARGEQAPQQYHHDLVAELSSLTRLSSEDLATLRILLDKE